MRIPLRTHHRHRAFTLIELLVVITIIAVIVAIALPIFGSVTNNSRRTQAVADERSLMTGIFAYMGDYNNKLPVNGDQQTAALSNSDAVYGGGQPEQFPNYLLMDILRGVADDQNLNDVLNPTKAMYFDEPYAKNPSQPRSGLVKTPYTHGSITLQPNSFVDPWSNEYIIWLDACRDGNLNNGMLQVYPAYPKDTDLSKPTYGPFGSVQIGSLGVDGKVGKNGAVDGSDDILQVQ